MFISPYPFCIPPKKILKTLIFVPVIFSLEKPSTSKFHHDNTASCKKKKKSKPNTVLSNSNNLFQHLTVPVANSQCFGKAWEISINKCEFLFRVRIAYIPSTYFYIF